MPYLIKACVCYPRITGNSSKNTIALRINPAASQKGPLGEFVVLKVALRTRKMPQDCHEANARADTAAATA